MQRLSETINPARPRKQGAAPPATHATTNRNRRAFTLVELLAVMLILSILVGLVVGVTGHVTARVNYERTIVTMQIVGEAIQAYREDQGSDPSSLSDLTRNAAAKKVLANLDSETWPGGSTIKDAYGNGLKYEKKGGLGECPVLISGGPDGNINTEDDNIRSDK